MAVQLLTALAPAQVIAVDQRDQALELAKQVGAHHGVVAGPAAAEEIMDLTAGKGADAVFDIVGADATLALAAAVTRPLGQLLIVGIAGGTLPLSFFGIAYEVSVATTYWGTLPELMELLSLAGAGHVRAHVQTFSLDDAPAAYERMRAGTLRGRAVIVPNP